MLLQDLLAILSGGLGRVVIRGDGWRWIINRHSVVGVRGECSGPECYGDVSFRRWILGVVWGVEEES